MVLMDQTFYSQTKIAKIFLQMPPLAPELGYLLETRWQ